MPEEQPRATLHELSREQKLGFIFLLVFGVVGIILGILQIRNTMFAKFSLNNSIPLTIKDAVNDVEAQRYRDTDGDGLTDYDETYEYDTSPYLYDTFGYGMSDKDVVEKGLPRCANAGKNCSNDSTPLSSPTTTPLISAATSTDAVDDFSRMLTDPKQVRSMLLQSGMKKEVLDRVKDEELMLMVKQLMTSSTFSSSTR